MPELITENKIVLTRSFVRKFLRCIDAAGSTMMEDDLMEISFMNNTVLIETDNINTIIRLEKQ